MYLFPIPSASSKTPVVFIGSLHLGTPVQSLHVAPRIFLRQFDGGHSGYRGYGACESSWNIRQPQLLAVMAKNGREGLNARQIAEHLHQDAIRVRKFIADNPKLLKKTGKGAGTKFFLP